jgi:hypothetical protein
MTALFTLAVAFQINDPDPLRWMAVYGSAAAISAYHGQTRRVPRVAAMLLATVAAVWAGTIAARGPRLAEYLRMFDEWEMRSAPIEAAREATGLLIVAVWMVVLVTRSRRQGLSRTLRY